MPLALVLAFKAKMGIQGLWLGFSIACVILDIGFAVIILYPSWSKISAKMKKSIEDGAMLTPQVSDYKHRFTPKGVVSRN